MERDNRLFLEGLHALSVLGHQCKIVVATTPQVQMVRAMLLAQGAMFAGVATHELYQELPESMARGGAGRHQRHQITRAEAPRVVQLVGARTRQRGPEVIDLLSEDEEDGDYGVRKSRSRPAPTRPETARPVPLPASARPARSADPQMYLALQEGMIVVARNSGKYPRLVQSYMRCLLNLADYVRGQEPRWLLGTTTPNPHILWVRSSYFTDTLH